MGAVRIVLNSAAVRDLLRSDEVLDDLEARAKKIADAANEKANDPAGHKVERFKGRNRGRAEVATATPKAMQAEATNRTLLSSLDAGRGD